jgi:ABC-type polysaccharide/polyol phosphate transport system ATPase subunit
VRAAVGAGTPSAIEVRHVGKRFRLFDRRWQRAAHWLGAANLGNPREIWALRDVSFDVERGECLGIIGVNGSGKSTLLKVVTGVLAPTTGECHVNGRLLALLELGTGFNPELTGRENVVLSTQLLGFPAGYARARMDEIETFCDIGPFFDRPMKIYSSGMFVRLAFSTFLFLEPDILVVDEALAVGDLFFQRKCFAAMAEIRARGATILFVSHDMAAIGNLCTRAILLERGEIAFMGDPEGTIARYFSHAGTGGARHRQGPAASSAIDPIELEAAIARHSILTSRAQAPQGELRIAAARVQDRLGRHTVRVRTLDEFSIQVLLEAEAPVAEPTIGLALYDRFNRLVCGLDAASLGAGLAALATGDRGLVTFRLRATLEPGEYSFSLSAYDRAGSDDPREWRCHDRHESLGPLHIAWDRELLPFYGLGALPCTAEYVSGSSA